MNIKKILVAFFLALVLLFPNFAFAQNDYGAGKAAGVAGLKNSLVGSKTPAAVIGEIVSLALSFVGIIFFVLILYAGFTWMTAMGSSEQVTKAKNIIETAIIGLVLVGGAYAISNFVFERLGAGGGAAGGTTGAVTAETCTKEKGADFSCKNFDSCADFISTSGADTSTKRAACTGSAGKCFLNICPGNDLNVCCK